MKIRERIENYGAKGLSEFELIALLVGVEVEVFEKFKTVKELREQYLLLNLSNLQNAKLKALFEVSYRIENQPYNVKKISSPNDILEHTKEMKHLQKEEFRILLLNTKNHIIKASTISIGTLNASLVHPREVFKEAVLSCANSIILVHNHPSGDSYPSQEDILLTDRLVEVGKMMGIQILDHVIVANDYYSFKEQGRIF